MSPERVSERWGELKCAESNVVYGHCAASATKVAQPLERLCHFSDTDVLAGAVHSAMTSSRSPFIMPIGPPPIPPPPGPPPPMGPPRIPPGPPPKPRPPP